jgi:hypothetical protein
MGRAHIGDDLDAFGGADRQHRPHPLLEQWVVTAVGVLHPRLLRQRDGALAEALEYQILDAAIFREFDRGLDAVTRIAGAGSYSDASQNDPGRLTCWKGLNLLRAITAAQVSRADLVRCSGVPPCRRSAGPLTSDGQMSHQDRNKRAVRPNSRRK